MFTDLFHALLDRANPPGHPLLAALLYNFCPAAAKWWLAGALPQPPFDPVWQALEDCARGLSIREALAEKGLETLWENAREYLGSVRDFRTSHRHVHAPELSAIFSGRGIGQTERFGLQEAFENFGGDWRNYYRYLHARYFVIPDWARHAGLDGQLKIRVQKIEICFALGFVRKAVRWPAWAIQARTGNIERLLLGLLLAPGQEQDVLRFFLAHRSGPAEGVWRTTPEVVGLVRSGLVVPHQALLPDKQIEDIIEKHIQLASEGPHPALHALRQPAICRQCGFRAQCFTPDNQLSPLVARTFERNIP